MDSKLSKKLKRMAVDVTFDFLLQNQNYQIFFVLKRVSVMFIEKSRQSCRFLKKNRS